MGPNFWPVVYILSKYVQYNTLIPEYIGQYVHAAGIHKGRKQMWGISRSTMHLLLLRLWSCWHFNFLPCNHLSERHCKEEQMEAWLTGLMEIWGSGCTQHSTFIQRELGFQVGGGGGWGVTVHFSYSSQNSSSLKEVWEAPLTMVETPYHAHSRTKPKPGNKETLLCSHWRGALPPVKRQHASSGLLAAGKCWIMQTLSVYHFIKICAQMARISDTQSTLCVPKLNTEAVCGYESTHGLD